MKELLGDVFDDGTAVDPMPVSAIPARSRPAAEPTDEEIAAVDTLDVARSILLVLRARFRLADDVRMGALASKVLAAIARIEQIEKDRPRLPTPDAVQAELRRLDGVARQKIEAYTAASDALFERRFAELRAWGMASLPASMALELGGRLDGLFAPPPLPPVVQS